MKKKLRELRRKREFIKLCKGALRKSYFAYWDRNCTIKRFGEKTNITNMDFIANMNLADKLCKYYETKIKAKSKKRNDINQMKGNKYFYQCNCGHKFSSSRKWDNEEIYCPETDCKTCIENRTM